MQISQRAFDMTVAEEVTSQAYYERHYTRPEWPGLASGVTVGIGYDLGQASRQKISDDWNKLVDPDMLMMMMSCSGITGSQAKAKCAEVKSKIVIPWNAALAVFANRDVPSWTAAVLRMIPGAEKLSPSCLGALVDTAYNRGCSFMSQGDRYFEMRAIRVLIGGGNLIGVAHEFQSMKRLWPNTSDLQRRCDHRIALWNYGLHEDSNAPVALIAPTPVEPDINVPLEPGPARTSPSETTILQHLVSACVATAPTAAASAAGFSFSTVVSVALSAIFVGTAIWVIWYNNRNPTILTARDGIAKLT